MQIPISAAASWPEPNRDNPEVLGPGNTVLITFMQALVTAIIAIRLYTRWKMSTGCRLDDILIVLAYIPTTGFAVGGIYQEMVLKADRHVWDFPPENSVASFKTSLADVIMFGTATTLTKLSMLALIHRITAAAGDRVVNWLVLAVVAVVSVDGLVFIAVELLQCSPLSLYWTPSLEPQDCIDEAVHLLVAGCINTATDFVIVLLPVRTVLRLGLPRRQLLVVQGLLAGGVLATVAGAVRTYYTWDMYHAPNFDITWRLHLVVSLSALELYIGIICASLAATKPFFQHFIPRLLGSLVVTDVTEPLSLRKSRPLSDDGESGLKLPSKLSGWDSAPQSPVYAATSPRTTHSKKEKKRKRKGSEASVKSNLAGQPRFEWRPVISSPVISSPITPVFRVKDTQPPDVQTRIQVKHCVSMPNFPRPPTSNPAAARGSEDATAPPESVASLYSRCSTPDLNKPLPKLKPATYVPGRRSCVLEPRAVAFRRMGTPLGPHLLSPVAETGGGGSGSGSGTSRFNSRGNGGGSSNNHTATLPRPPRATSAYASIPASLPSSSPGSPTPTTSSPHASSVYDFMAYADGHISVHKAMGLPWNVPPDPASRDEWE